ncbi:MAG: metallophosphoesterase [Aeromicrobium erythreum]
MVRVLAVADEEVEPFEARAASLDVALLLAAGDLPWDYLERLVALLGVPGVFVPGNHEPDTRQAAPRGFVSADETVVEVAGLRVAGLGGCVRYNGGRHQYTQDQHADRARRVLRRAGGHGVDVLLTHAPPLGLGDEPDPSHVGIAALHDLIDELRPSWHLHGHIHPYGLRKPDRERGATTVRNVIPWTVMDVEPGVATARAGAGTGDRRW